MTKYIKILSILSISMMFVFSACVKNKFDEPEKATYNPDIEETSTIQELKNLYTGQLTLIDTNVVIKGTVIANDKSGNIYKAIYLQDSTDGIQISLDAYELHNLYHVGDLVYVKCEGLYLGEYGGQIQLGSDYEGSVGRIAEPLIEDYLIKSDGGEPIEPKELNLSSVNGSLVNELVFVNDVHFLINEINGTYADGINHVDRDTHIEDCDGHSIIVRTSGYADFANDSLPKGNGKITAVLTKYNSDYQLIIRNPREVNMENERCGNIYYHSFYSEGLGSFTSYSVSGTQEWIYDASYGAVMNGYPNANEDWLISPAIDLTSFSGISLRFRHAQGYLYTGFENDLKVFICDDYDGVSNPNTSGSWTELTGITYSPDWWNWVESGDIDISAFNNNPHVFIAFKYTSTASNSCAWEIDNMRIRQ